MDDILPKPFFVRWLKENGVYLNFIRNISDINRQGFSSGFLYACLLNNYRDIINDSFTWHKTIEGYKFWAKYHKLWQKYLLYER